MRVSRRLWDQHLGVTALDEMDRANISHDFGTGIDLGVELFFELGSTLAPCQHGGSVKPIPSEAST